MKTKNKNRIWSFILSAMLSIEQIAFAMPSISKAADSAKNTGTVLFPSGNDAAQLIHDDNLVDNGDGTFTFTSKISAQYSYSDVSKSRLQTADGFYPFEKPGKYLIELWGGDGGDGGRALLSGRNGLGGQGGFVYGTLDVTQEMVTAKSGLRYEIGSKGESKTYDMSGGGSAGEGGGAGEIALVSVGAGGGYSAVYLVANENTPLGDKDTYSENGRDDPSKVLMIAGGGGGGAAGANGFHLTALILKMHGDGGDGGSKDSSIYATPAIGNFNTGTYYAGENGTSSGGKTSYVGQGGTDRPEGLAKTTIGFMTASTYANDWQMTYHPDMDTPRRGVGGAGNLHGGGGGAGFAGGGGGIQNVIIDANNVGGGGGGSSYVASAYNESDQTGIKGFTAFDPIIKTAQYKDYFVEREDNTNKDTGGAIVIRYLEDKDYYDYLDDVNITGTVSDYFTVESATCESSKTGLPSDLGTSNNISFSGSIAPYDTGLTMGQPKNTLTLTLKLKPKDGFAGGKNVPIFTVDENNMAFTCTEVTDSVDKKSCKFLDINNAENPDEKDVSHVNVKLNVDYSTNSLVKGIGDNYTADQLKNTPVSYDANNKMHDFITGINYEVLDNNNAVFSGYTVQSSDKDTIKTYTVKATITPNSNQAAKVGDAGSGVITKTAKVKCVEESPLYVDGFYVNAKKKLTYNETDKTYDFDVDLTANLDNDETIVAYPPIETEVIYDNTNTGSSNITTNISLTPGIYYVEAWGGDGGNGGNNTGLSIISGLSGSGGKGGKGGFVNRYITVSEQTSVKITLGAKGDDGDNNIRENNVEPGNGGKATYISIETTDYIIAGGGGGGGKPISYGLADNNSHVGYYGRDGGTTPNNGQYDGSIGNTISSSSFSNDDIDTYFAKGGQNYTKPNSDNTPIAIYDVLSDIPQVDSTEIVDIVKDNLTISRGPIAYVYELYYQTDIFGVQHARWYVDHSTDSDSTNDNIMLNTTYENTSKSYDELVDKTGGAVKITKLGVKGDINGVKYESVSDYDTDLETAKSTAVNNVAANISTKVFSITEKFSDYFDFVSAEALTGEYANVAVTTSINADNSYGIGLVVSTSLAKEKVTSYTSTETSAQPVSGYGYYVNKTTYTYTLQNIKLGARVKLKPKEGFLGGNEVPLLDKALNEENTDTPKKTAVKIEHSNTTTAADDDVGYVDANPMTDYANVTIDKDGIGFNDSPSEIIVDYGGTIQSSDVSGKVKTLAEKYPNSSDSWKYDFVQLGATTFSPTESFTEDGICSVVGVLNPITATAQKAVVIPSVSPAKNSAQIPVKVKYTVTKTLTYLNSAQSCLNGDSPGAINGDKFTRDDIHDAYVLEITPPAYVENGTNYDLPDASAVTVTYDTNNNTVSAADVSKVEGKLVVTIPASAFTDNITITADGVEQNEDTKHKVKYYYEVYDPLVKNVNNGITYVSEDGESYSRGQTINKNDTPFNPDYTQHPEEFPDGYTSYYWTWGEDKSDSATYVMGDTDVYVVGRYVPKTYTLIVHYQYENGTEAHEDYTSPPFTQYDETTDTYKIALTEGAQYYVVSPTIAGYVPDKPVVAGTVDTSDPEPVTVTYSAESALNICLIEHDIYDVPISSSTVHSIAAKDTAVLGKEVFKTTKLDTNGKEVNTDTIDESGTYYVYYRPVRSKVQVTFDANAPSGKTASPTADQIRYVVKGMEYGYNCKTENGEYSFDGLPRVVCNGYLFDGWYTEGGQLITEDMIVPNDSAGTIKLYAHWKLDEITITVDYYYANDVTDASLRGQSAGTSKTATPLRYGMSYKIDSYSITGYKASDDPVTGVAFEDETRYVYYSDYPQASGYTEIKLNVNVYSESNRSAPGSDTPKSANNKLSGGKFALYDSTGTTRIGTIKESDGAVSWTSVEAAIAADGTYKLVCEDPPTGYGATSRNVELRTVAETKTEGGKTVNIYAANIFLDKSPFQLPMAGSKPMTGYTVFGISAMLLAGLLMFAYVNSRTEENNEKE